MLIPQQLERPAVPRAGDRPWELASAASLVFPGRSQVLTSSSAYSTGRVWRWFPTNGKTWWYLHLGGRASQESEVSPGGYPSNKQ